MNNTCYHLISDQQNEFLNDFNEVKKTITKWKDQGETHIKIFRIVTEELGSDAINLIENQLTMDEIN